MIPLAPAALALAPAITDLGSWFADIGGRLMRGIINADEALAEMRQHQADTDKEIAEALAGVVADRARIDAKIDSLPSVAAAPPSSPAQPAAPAPAAAPSAPVPAAPATPPAPAPAAPVVPAVVAPQPSGEE